MMAFDRDLFWVGGETVDTPVGSALLGQMFVEHLVPASPNGLPPVICIHGGGGQGLDWLATPDGRPGWAPLLADRGFDVYVIDRVAHGRSPYAPLLGGLAPPMPFAMIAGVFFPPPTGEGSHPSAGQHSQWPGGRTFDDPVVRQFVASQGPMLADPVRAQLLDQAALTELVERTGPAYVIGHSAGGPAAILLADARPDRVAGLLLCEPLGPPIVGLPGMPPPAWGPTHAPLTYDPPVADPSELDIVVDHSGPVPLALQAQPARRLAALATVAITTVTAEASVFRWFENHMAAYLQQAGCTVDQIRLWEHGIHGNSHGFPFELNHAEILDLVVGRLTGGPAG